MTRIVLALASACALLAAAAPAPGQDVERKRIIDARIENLESRIDQAREREGVLTAEIATVTEEIEGLESEVGAAEARLDELEGLLALQQRRLDRLNELFHLQTSRLVNLRRQHAIATKRLNRRIVQIYTSEPTEPLGVVLEAASFGDMLDQLEFLSDIGRQDERLVAQVERAKLAMRSLREETRKTRTAQARITREVEARTAEQRAIRDRLAWTQRELATTRRAKSEALVSVEQQKAQFIAEADGLRADSAALAAQIRSAQSAAPASAPTVSGSATPSAAGFVWPVQGVLTSPYGARWGRIHEGIDIAAPTGTPIVAAAAGTVIVSGWSGGYGYLVVIDHGNGLATAYAHNSSLVAGVGQQVAQGQLIAYVGNTGNSFGSHVHFEVRVNGAAVDPLGYL